MIKTAAITLCLTAAVAGAQGILTVTPSRTGNTVAGTGSVGYAGDGGSATAAALALPAAVAYDKAGNLFIADANNHVIREVTPSGTITTVAGSGVAGFGGDGASATAAFLDTPVGVAVDTNGNLYIADSHNQRIRKVAGGSISTIAGAGTAGFAGDGAVATAASLNMPSGVAVDAGGNVYIADTNNQRIRKITGTTISTVAGNGEQIFAGDGAAATAASLDSPTGVAVDTAGNIYIADRHNQRIRQVSTTGTISTLAGSGTATFAGGFSGDGSSATAATLAKPTGISVDPAGNIYIADTNNQRVRQLGGGAIATIAGTGSQGFGGDGGAASGVLLNAPRGVAADSAGNIAVADTLDQRIRTGSLPTLGFIATLVGVASSAQPVTLSNSGTAPITVSSVSFTGPFAVASGGSCSAAPVTLAPGASCTENVAYIATNIGSASGSVVFGGTGVVNQTVLLTGSGARFSTTTSVSSNATAPFINQTFTLTATVSPAGPPTPTGTVSFYSGTTLLGTSTLTNGTATLNTSFAASGTYVISASYSGDAAYASSSSQGLTQSISNFDFTISPVPGTSINQTVLPGQAATYNLLFSPLAVPFTLPIALTYSGLPPGATATLTPSSLTLGNASATSTFVVQTAKNTSMLRYLAPTGTTALALLLLPFASRKRRSRRLKPLLMLGLCVFSLAALAGITGCGTGTGFLGQQQKTYIITVTGTATGPNGAILQHSTALSLTIE